MLNVTLRTERVIVMKLHFLAYIIIYLKHLINNDVILIIFDLSAAFDTIDHDIHLSRLEQRYGITGVALKLFRSYLKQRNASVLNGSLVSESVPHCGVPRDRFWDLCCSVYIQRR